ncbi:hypothetical protein INR49_025277 [Caranx melampygus]|nr:hypothetical protein INR49_025277 [Caranx melampygus]
MDYCTSPRADLVTSSIGRESSAHSTSQAAWRSQRFCRDRASQSPPPACQSESRPDGEWTCFSYTAGTYAYTTTGASCAYIPSKFTKMIPNGYLIFEDESFLDSTVAKMNALRKSGQFCDVRLQVCGHELMAHRAVLACCSPYLFEIFNSDLEPHGVSHVTFEDLDPEAVEILLNYAYTAQLKADKERVKEVYSAAKRFKMERVKQICGDYLLSKMDSQNAISFRNFASSMGDARVLAKVDAFIQDHLLEVSEQEDFLKLPRLKLEVMLEDNLTLPSNGKLYSKVLNWVQRSLWENGDQLERLMEEVQTLYYSPDHKLVDGGLVIEGHSEVFGGEEDHLQFVQKKPVRESTQRQMSCSSSGSLSPSNQAANAPKQTGRREWKYIASEKTTSKCV